MIAGFQSVDKAIVDWLISPITNLNDKWQEFLKAMGIGGGGGGGSKIPGGTVWAGKWLPGYFGNTSLPSPGPTKEGYYTYEEYPWEGRSSNYGPSGNHLMLNRGVGLGINVQKQWGVQQGDWVNLSGGYGWRQLNEDRHVLMVWRFIPIE